jgi:carboxymethylenebutenolidase
MSKELERFATAILPEIAPTTLLTPSDGLQEDWHELATDEGSLPFFVARPAQAAGPLPVVLVVQEIFGVHAHIRDVARRFAHLGYLAIAPELFVRLGDPSRAATIDVLRTEFVAKAPDSRVLSDLDAVLEWSSTNGGDPDRVALTGFCWGGRMAWLYAAHQPRLKAAVAWYGRLQAEPMALQPVYPVDLAGKLSAPVLGLYGGQDQGIPLADVDLLKERLAAAGSPSRIEVYPDSPHAFYADYRPSYREADAKDAWESALSWFREHGV